MRARSRRLATVLFVDVVDSTRIAAEVGDRQWRQLLDRFRSTVRRQTRAFRGREVDTAGDGFFATFDRPGDALRAAAAVARDVQGFGLEVRAGLHAGELETIEGRLGGLAAHIGARVMASAGPAEVLATSTVRDLGVGDDVRFAAPRDTELKGLPGNWALHRVVSVDGTAMPVALDPDEADRRRGLPAGPIRPGRAGRVAIVALGATMVAVAAVGVLAFGGAPRPGAGLVPSGSGSASSSGGGSPSGSLSATRPPPVALVRIDPARFRIAALVRDEALRPGGAHLRLVAGNLWQADDLAMTRRDLETGAAVTSLPLPGGTWGVHVAFGSIWIGYLRPVGVFDRVDATSGRLQAHITPGEMLWDFTAGDTGLYLLTRWSGVATHDSRILEIDPRSSAIVDDDRIQTETEPVYVGFYDGKLYLCECGAHRFTAFDPVSDEVVQVIESPQLGFGGSVRDPVTGVLWVGDRGASTLTPFDENLKAGRPIGLDAPPHGFAVGFGAVWVAAEGFVYRIDSATQEARSLRMPEGASAVSIVTDEETDTIWVGACQYDCQDL